MFSFLGRHSGEGWLQSAILVYGLIIILYDLSQNNKLSGQKRLWNALFLLYLGLVIDLTIFPIPISEEAFIHIQTQHHFKFSLIPFNDLINSGFHRQIILQMALNLVLFIPFGLLYPLTSFKFMKKNPLLLGFLFSLTIELIQLITSYFSLNVRIFDTDDLIMNTLGVLIGYFLFKMIKKYNDRQHSRSKKQT